MTVPGSRTARALGTAALSAAVLLPAIAGCGGADTSPSEHSERGTASTATDRPLDDFAPSEHELVALTAARQELTRRCAVRNGSTYTDHRGPDLTQLRSGERRYGIFRLDEAEELGYRVAEREGEQTAGVWTPDIDELRVVTGRSPDGAHLLPTDRPRDSLGNPLPDGGCLGEASALLDAGPPPDRELVARLEFQAYRAAESDERVQDLWASWSRCMATAGYEYATPWEPNDRHWLPSEDELQRRTAAADVRCRADIDLAARWRAVEAEHQRLVMASDTQALDIVRERIAERIARADSILAD